MEKYSEKLARILDFIIFVGSVVVILAWVLGKPLFYNPNGPVMSIFTAISLFFWLVFDWPRYFALPFTGNIALLMIVVEEIFSSMMMLSTAAKVHVNTFLQL